jgi:hypothetical protein
LGITTFLLQEDQSFFFQNDFKKKNYSTQKIDQTELM